MPQHGQRIHSKPLIIPDNAEPYFLKQIAPSERSFPEDWLQQLIHEHPELLPASEIESVFGPLISIGREIPTNVGPIDNLFISPQGYLTIVETKLWRNPEARRIVVGQIIDYAKEVSKWSFGDLDQKVRAYFQSSHNKKTGIIDSIKSCDGYEDEDESELIDTITKNIRKGHFLLLIAGDGIRESVEDMTEYLSRTPQLHFTLALVELKIYETNDGKLVLPQLVMRTQEITRAVIRIEGGHVEKISVDMDLGTDKLPSRSKRYSITEEEFFSELAIHTDETGINLAQQLIEDSQDLGCVIIWRQSSFVIRYPAPLDPKQLLTLLVISRDGIAYTGWLVDQLKKVNMSADLGEKYISELNTLLKDFEIDPAKPGVWSLTKIAPNHDEVLLILKDFIDRVIA